MSQQSLRLITRLGARARTQSPALSRSLHTTPASLRTNDTKPKTSQGHTVDKAKDPLYRDGDVQSAAARAGADAKNKSGSRSGETEPFDAARQGQTGGETKRGEGTGPFKDQIGGQDVKGKGPGVKEGKEEVAAGGNIRETIVNSFESLKKMRSDERNFSTSARAWNGTTPRADADGSRQPKEKASDLQGDQNAHLRHTSGGSQGGKNQGNASADPKLPSQNKSSSSSQTQTRSFSTTARTLADPNAPGVGSPGPAEREAQKGAGIKQQPRGDDAQHGGAAGQPSAVESKGAPESSPNPTTGTAAPDPQIPKGQKEGATREGMGVRKFSTSARVMADPNAPGVGGPGVAEKEAQKGAGIKQQPRGDDAQHGGAAGQPSAVESKGAPESSPNPTTGTAAPDPQIPKAQKEGATRQGMGVRKFSTSARLRATTPPGGYAKAKSHESSEAGYNAPPTALPGQLKSAYEEKDPNAVQRTSGDGASSNVPYSSTAVDPPNEALRQAVLDGTMPERNPPPQPEAGPQGIDEAWKHRK